MGRRKVIQTLKNNSKGKLVNSLPGNSFSVDGYSAEDMIGFMMDRQLDDESGTLTVACNDIITTALGITTLCQLRYSTTETSQYFDQLPSVKMYKRKIICDTGLMWCNIIPSYETIDLLDIPLIDILKDFYGTPISPTKKVGGKPTPGNVVEWFKHRRSVVLGYMQSCPSTKAQAFGLDQKCTSWTVDDALKFICPNGLPTPLTKDMVISNFLDSMLTGTNDTKIELLDFDEPNNLKSIIEEEILGDKIKRNGSTSSKAKGGELPDNRITKALMEEHLTFDEQRQYKVALRFGNSQKLKELNNLISTRSLMAASPSDPKAGKKKK